MSLNSCSGDARCVEGLCRKTWALRGKFHQKKGQFRIMVSCKWVHSLLNKHLWRRSNQSILKETNPEYSLKWLMLKLKLQYFGHLMQRVDSRKHPDAGKDWRQKEKGAAEDEMVRSCHVLNGHESEQTLGNSEGWDSLACGSPWGCKDSDTTKRLNNSNNYALCSVGRHTPFVELSLSL